jgi:hypothetical protein
MTITLGEKEITLEYITINQYKRMLNEQEMPDINYISLLTGLTIEELRDVDFQQINFVSKFLKTWVNNLQKTPLTLEREYKGQRLGLIQPKSMTYGEFSDLHVLVSSENIDFELITSILYRPILEGSGEDRILDKYDYDQCIKRSKEMGDFPINDYISAVFFFVKFYEIQLEDSHLSSVKKKKEE